MHKFDHFQQTVVRKQQQEEALTHRKRSSRLAIKEIEKEEARSRAIKEAEENEKLDRARRAEARARKEEESRIHDSTGGY